MENRLNAVDIVKWIFLLPISMLLAEISSGAINKLISFLENYIFGKDFFHYYWSLFCVAIYGAIYGFFLCATAFLVAPKYKKISTYIVLTIIMLFTILTFNEFNNHFFYSRIIGILIIGLITPGIIKKYNQEDFIFILLYFFGLLILIFSWVTSIFLHFWTVKLAYQSYGIFAGLCAFFMPIISEMFFVVKLWSANNGYVKLFFIVLILVFLRKIISKIDE